MALLLTLDSLITKILTSVFVKGVVDFVQTCKKGYFKQCLATKRDVYLNKPEGFTEFLMGTKALMV